MQRVLQLKKEINSFPPSICIERAVIYTRYFKNKTNRRKPVVIQMAEALASVLTQKSVKIYPDELLVGTTTSKRVAGPIFPELHGVAVMEDLFRFPTRKVNPLQITRQEQLILLKDVLPFWLNKFLAMRSFPFFQALRFVRDQLNPDFYLINESGGISHFVPDYETILNIGLNGVREQINYKLAEFCGDPQKEDFYKAMLIVLDGIIKMAENYSQKARELAAAETNPSRKQELLQIAEICQHVPREGARTFYEALQSLWLVHIGINLESLDNSVSPGRMDQYLYPFYRRDLEQGKITRDRAKELIGCFTVKCSELIPVFCDRITRFHGGMFNGQVVSVGGMDSEGNDATNELTMIFLEIMDELRMRQPNYHARIHSGSPDYYLAKIATILSQGSAAPALYNDEVIIKVMMRQGYSLKDARNYGTVGCVEPTSCGKSFASTDAALFNVPICLELALNQGKKFNSRKRIGIETPPPESFKSLDDLKNAFKIQLQYQIDRLITDLHAIELGNRNFHPTPLSSLTIKGCIEKGSDSTAGGAEYNFSGIQGVGVTTVGDSLFALEKLIFEQQKYSLTDLVDALRKNFKGYEDMQAEMLALAKFGNDIPEVDACTQWVIDAFGQSLRGKINTRGGAYIPGYYSVTAHQEFGRRTGALPNGRKQGEAFPSGIAPMNGYDRLGITALLNSVTRLNILDAGNGINFNIKFNSLNSGGEILKNLLQAYFKMGGMQIQVNAIDAKILQEAKLHPEKYPHLVVRVSGYSAYFNDLSPEMKDEIIQRMTISG